MRSEGNYRELPVKFVRHAEIFAPSALLRLACIFLGRCPQACAFRAFGAESHRTDCSSLISCGSLLYCPGNQIQFRGYVEKTTAPRSTAWCENSISKRVQRFALACV